MRLPQILELAQARGHAVFQGRMDPNLVVLRGPGLPGEWDGLLHLAYRPGSASGWTVHVWPCATRPGARYLRSPMNLAGTAVVEPGQYRGSHLPGMHRGRPSLVQDPNVPVLVRRDNDRDSVLEPGEIDIGWGLNVHDITSPNDLAGCTGLLPLHLSELLDAFRKTISFAGEHVSLTVVTL